MASQAEAVGDTEVWNRQTEQLELKLGVQQGTGVGTALQQALMRHPGRGSCPGGPAAEKRRGRAAPAPAPEGSARRPSRDVPPPRALPGTARPPHRSFPQENLPPTSRRGFQNLLPAGGAERGAAASAKDIAQDGGAGAARAAARPARSPAVSGRARGRGGPSAATGALTQPCPQYNVLHRDATPCNALRSVHANILQNTQGHSLLPPPPMRKYMTRKPTHTTESSIGMV